MGLVACKAAYSGGGSWLASLLEYLGGNLDYMRQFLCERIPQVKLIEPEGTYLVWLDFSALKLGTRLLRTLSSTRPSSGWTAARCSVRAAPVPAPQYRLPESDDCQGYDAA
jgi:bifunctional pyridoxal-dependent enzyme with beta-cystathionase and maltose regulon repressor activities